MPFKIPKPETAVGGFIELVAVVALAVGLALAIQAVIIKPFQIPSGSMIPTLDINQRVLVNRFVYRFSDPDVGDVVVFHPPTGADARKCGAPRDEDQPCPEPTDEETDDNYIKRIVAGPGDRLRVEHGHAVVNGEVADEDFIVPCKSMSICNLGQEITIPPDHYFMMGDNRGASDDSRYWGPIHRDWIVGQAFVTYWPPDRIGLL